jgi:hypothetical protein
VVGQTGKGKRPGDKQREDHFNVHTRLPASALAKRFLCIANYFVSQSDSLSTRKISAVVKLARPGLKQKGVTQFGLAHPSGVEPETFDRVRFLASDLSSGDYAKLCLELKWNGMR